MPFRLDYVELRDFVYLTQQLEAKDAELDASKKEHATCQQTIEDLQMKLAALEKEHSPCADMIADLKKQLAGANQERSALDSANDEIKKLREQLIALRDERGMAF